MSLVKRSYRTPMVAHGELGETWYHLDAEGMVLGRFATRISNLLKGKDKPSFTPHALCGDHVVVVNANKVVTSGKKMQQKLYRHHSGYPGGLKEVTLGRMMAKHPERVIEHAVRGMLPKTILGRQMLLRLHVYAGPDHPHKAQKPVPVPLGTK